MKDKVARVATIRAVEVFDPAALNKTETVEKNYLPRKESFIGMMRVSLEYLIELNQKNWVTTLMFA